MFDDTIINGGRKVPRKPSLAVYDVRHPASPAADPAYNAQFNTYLDKDAGRGHAEAKALLVALGVDGDVPLAQARVNAGLDKWPGERGQEMTIPLRPGQRVLPANDNHEIAAKAA